MSWPLLEPSGSTDDSSATTESTGKEISVTGWTNTDGAPTLAALRSKPVVVEFWATWCPPCVKSTPHLVEIAQRYADQDLVVLGIHSKTGAENEEKIAAFIERFGMPYAVGLDTEGKTGRAWGVTGIPKAFVFDRSGAEIWSGHPANEEFDEAVAKAVLK
jgi:thiol-disulfide isomerase/thioredoxin